MRKFYTDGNLIFSKSGGFTDAGEARLVVVGKDIGGVAKWFPKPLRQVELRMQQLHPWPPVRQTPPSRPNEFQKACPACGAVDQTPGVKCPNCELVYSFGEWLSWPE